MIDKNKTYKTRDGREVRIYATDGGDLFEDRTIHGAVKSRNRWVFAVWNAMTGRCFASLKGETEMDLIEVRPRHKRTVFLHVFKNGSVCSTEEAYYVVTGRIACIKVELDFEEGQGL